MIPCNDKSALATSPVSSKKLLPRLSVPLNIVPATAPTSDSAFL